MQLNEKAFALGRKCSIIREIFEYSKTRASEIGADKVYDFSLGNPSFESPQEVTDTIKDCSRPKTLRFCTAILRRRATLTLERLRQNCVLRR